MVENMKWEFERLKEESKENKEKISELQEWKTDVEIHRASLTEKLITIFKRLDSIEDTSKWLNRMAVATLATGVVGVVGALITWLVQK